MKSLNIQLNLVWRHCRQERSRSVRFSYLATKLFVPYRFSRHDIKMFLDLPLSRGIAIIDKHGKSLYPRITATVRTYLAQQKHQSELKTQRKRNRRQRLASLSQEPSRPKRSTATSQATIVPASDRASRSVPPLPNNFSLLTVYLDQIHQYQVLSQKQVKSLDKQYQHGCHLAGDRLVESNLGLVVKIARNFLYTGASFGDLIQFGNLGLMRATQKYNYRLGYHFSTYAYNWIKQYIKRGLANKEHLIRIPVHKVQILHRLRYVITTFSQDLGRRPYPSEVLAEVRIKRSVLLSILSAYGSKVSLDAPIGINDTFNHSTTMLNYVPNRYIVSPERKLSRDSLHHCLAEMLQHLKPRQRNAVEHRFGFNNLPRSTYKQIGNLLGISSTSARSYVTRGLHSMHEMNASQYLKGFLKQ